MAIHVRNVRFTYIRLLRLADDHAALSGKILTT